MNMTRRKHWNSDRGSDEHHLITGLLEEKRRCLLNIGITALF